MKKIHHYLEGVKEKEGLARHTSFKIGGEAELFYNAKNSHDLVRALNVAISLGVPYEIIAGGSNILVSDNGVAGLVIKIGGNNFSIENNIIETEAGVSLAFLMSKAVSSGLAGLEWAAGIPGTIGGAIVGNAGSFEKSVSDVVESVIAYDPKNKEVISLKNKDCNFNYRDSVFKKGNLVILKSRLNLKPGDKDEIVKKIDENLSYKRERHPIGCSAGSIFKNINKMKIPQSHFIPKYNVIKWSDKMPAGFLVDELGLKGYRIGNAIVSDKHGNFILNKGGASGRDISSLIELIKSRAKDRFGVVLEEEIRYIGFNK